MSDCDGPRVLDRVSRQRRSTPLEDAVPAPAPPAAWLLRMQAGAGNVAVTSFAQQARLLRNHKKYKDESGYGDLQNDKERELYGALRDAGFSEDDIAVAGPRTPQRRPRGVRRRTTVARGGQGRRRVAREGEPDADVQHARRAARSASCWAMRTKKLNVDHVQVTLDEYLGPQGTDDGRANLALTVTHLDDPDALLAIETIVGQSEEPEFYPTTIHQDLKFSNETIQECEGFQDDGGPARSTRGCAPANDLIASDEDWEGEPADSMASNGGMLEQVYTSFREATMHKQPHTELEQLDEKLGVHVTLAPGHARRAEGGSPGGSRGRASRMSEPPARRLDAAPARNADEDNDAYATRSARGRVRRRGGLLSLTTAYWWRPSASRTCRRRSRRSSRTSRRSARSPPKIWERYVDGTYVAKEDKVTRLHTIHGNSPKARGTGDSTRSGPRAVIS